MGYEVQYGRSTCARACFQDSDAYEELLMLGWPWRTAEIFEWFKQNCDAVCEGLVQAR